MHSVVAKSSLRVVGGELRGRRFSTVAGNTVRPTSDRAREAAFNLLFSLGLPDGAAVVDAFAGSGALGIEAVSRGATRVSFLERDSRAADCIEANLATLDIAASAEVVRGDAVANIGRHGVGAALVLADPPYDFDRWGPFLAACPADAVLLLESGRELDDLAAPGHELYRSRRYGRAVLTILTPRGG